MKETSNKAITPQATRESLIKRNTLIDPSSRRGSLPRKKKTLMHNQKLLKCNKFLCSLLKSFLNSKKKSSKFQFYKLFFVKINVLKLIFKASFFLKYFLLGMQNGLRRSKVRLMFPPP